MDLFCEDQQHMELIRQAVACNTVGTVNDGSATEIAMLQFIVRCETDYHYYREHYECQPKIRFHFDSSRKRMSTVIELDGDEETEHGYARRLHTKGAAEIILQTCTHYIDSMGERTLMHDEDREELLCIIQTYAKLALRTIAFAYKDLQKGEGGENHDYKAERSNIY